MIEISVNSLNELEQRVADLRLEIQANRRHDYQVLSDVLFRGQGNADWPLLTTLERYSVETFTVSSYNTILQSVYPATSSFTGKEWPFDRERDKSENHFSSPPNYEFMVYARHHGFPTPLLDWSQSLYVALFFAFQKTTAENVAVFTYVECLGGGKSGWVGAPQICELGPYVASHKRHFIQQGQYTVAVRHNEHKQWTYCSHMDALNDSTDETQDIVHKFILTSSLKKEVLEKLNEMNVNAFTLYGNEESLMETLAYKEFRKRGI